MPLSLIDNNDDTEQEIINDIFCFLFYTLSVGCFIGDNRECSMGVLSVVNGIRHQSVLIEFVQIIVLLHYWLTCHYRVHETMLFVWQLICGGPVVKVLASQAEYSDLILHGYKVCNSPWIFRRFSNDIVLITAFYAHPIINSLDSALSWITGSRISWKW